MSITQTLELLAADAEIVGAQRLLGCAAPQQKHAAEIARLLPRSSGRFLAVGLMHQPSSVLQRRPVAHERRTDRRDRFLSLSTLRLGKLCDLAFEGF